MRQLNKIHPVIAMGWFYFIQTDRFYINSNKNVYKEKKNATNMYRSFFCRNKMPYYFRREFGQIS